MPFRLRLFLLVFGNFQIVVYWFVLLLLLLFFNEHVLEFYFPKQFYASRLTMTCNQNLRTAMEIREITFSFCVILGTD